MSVLSSFSPTTRACGIIQAEPTAVRDTIIRILEERDEKLLPLSGLGQLLAPTTHQTRKMAQGLQDALRALDPLCAGIVTRHLVLETVARWSVCFNNSKLADGDRDLTRELSGQLGTTVIYAKKQEHTLRKLDSHKWTGLYGAFVFYVHNSGNLVRAVENTFQDRGWDFCEEGSPFSFEDTEQYSARKKADRFNGDMLVRYLRELGVRPYDDDFYLVDGRHPTWLVERIDYDERLKGRTHCFPLAQVQAEAGIKE